MGRVFISFLRFADVVVLTLPASEDAREEVETEEEKRSARCFEAFLANPAEDMSYVDNLDSFLGTSFNEKLVNDFEPQEIENDSEVQDDDLEKLNQSLDKII